ncbi:unnamed protein product [Cuscuta campestris]|uniref:Uncharacterized protein n=1 Tax=Cuscuta campestris TaxID=132261 RepID=A0A484L549_9ASTE|nr:unnamed protein product [Cuscuta campestris]
MKDTNWHWATLSNPSGNELGQRRDDVSRSFGVQRGPATRRLFPPDSKEQSGDLSLCPSSIQRVWRPSRLTQHPAAARQPSGGVAAPVSAR